jgi:hypothetical protein
VNALVEHYAGERAGNASTRASRPRGLSALVKRANIAALTDRT